MRACDRCLRRALLLTRLAGHIERAAAREPGSRAAELLALEDGDLVAAVGGLQAGSLLEDAARADLARLRGRLRAAACWCVCRHDPDWPPGLADPADAPRALLGRGDPTLLASLDPTETVTVVGARRATAYGRATARRLGRELALAGLTVVSGMAWGIDGEAHRGALEVGPTLAVLGCGPDVAYPAGHRRLYAEIVERGAVVSELLPGMRAWRWAFPARNRIMAALARMTVVVEAAAHSGSLITSDMALELGREVGAVPGPVDSARSVGANNLLAEGATVVRDGGDVLTALFGPGERAARRRGPKLDARLAAALAAVEAGATDCDALATSLGLGGSDAAAALARLEVLGYLEGSFSGSYTITGLPPPEDEPARNAPA
jgi:DNA processing protein